MDYDSASGRLRAEMLSLAEAHAANLAQSRALKMSAVRDSTQLQNGLGQSDYFASRMYQQGAASLPTHSRPSSHGPPDGLTVKQHPSASSVSVSLSKSSTQAGLASPASIGPSPTSPPHQVQPPKSAVASLLTEGGLRLQEERVIALRSRALQIGGGGTLQSSSPTPSLSATGSRGAEAFPRHAQTPPGPMDDLQPPLHARQLFEEARAANPRGRLIVDGESVSAADYLEKWLRDEVAPDDAHAHFLSPGKGLGPSSSTASTASAAEQRSLAPSGSQRSGVGSEDLQRREAMKAPKDALDMEMGEQPVLRSRSSHETLRPGGAPPGRAYAPTAGGEEEGGREGAGNGGKEYVYARGFDQHQRKRDRPRRVPPHRGGGSRKVDDEEDYTRQDRYAQHSQPHSLPHQQYPPGPYQAPYGGFPHMAMPQMGYQHMGMGVAPNPYAAPYGGPPAPYGGYGMPPYQQPYPAMAHPHVPYPGQPPPPHYSSPPPQSSPTPTAPQEPYMQQLQLLAEQLEKENVALSAASAPSGQQAGSTRAEDERGQSDSNIPSYIHHDSNSGSGGTGGRRLNRAELKHREEMRQMQFEMEKLRQSQALEELRGDMERRRVAKKAESDHEVGDGCPPPCCCCDGMSVTYACLPGQHWLEEQKRQLQALKIKQALAVEEEILKSKTDPPQPSSAGPSVHPEGAAQANAKVTSPAAPQEPKLQNHFVDGLNFTVDGAAVPLEDIKGAEFRMACAMFSSSGKPLGRTLMSEWTPWDRSVAGSVGGGKDVSVQYLSSPLAKKPPKSSKYSAKACAGKGEEELGSDLGNFATVLTGLQYRDGPDGASKPLGWAVCSHPLVSLRDEVLPGGKEDDSRVYPGCWRLKIRKGMPNATGRQKASVEDATDGWLLFRVTTDSVALGDAKWCSGKDLGMVGDLAAVFDNYGPLEGGGAPAVQTQQSSLRRMSTLIRPPSTNGLKPPSTAGSTKIDRKPSSVSTSSRLSRATSKMEKDAKHVSSAKSLAPLASRDDDDEDSVQPAGDADRKAGDDSDNDTKHSGHESGDEEPEKMDPIAKFWTLGTPNGPCNEKYQKGDGIDLYVDTAMFLPDNVAISRCVVKVLTSDYEVIGQAREATAHLHEGSALSPVYRLKVEIRQAVMNTTATALLRIDAMTTDSCESVGVGYAAIKLFSTRDREQPTAVNAPGIFLNTGNFQLPLYGGRLQKAKVMNEHCLTAASMPRIPCSSLLVRILPAPKSSDGIDVMSKADYPQSDWPRLRLMVPPPGVYASGCYDGHLCEPRGGELHAFEAKAAHMTGSVLSVCRQAVAACPPSLRPSHVSSPPDNATQDQLDLWSRSLMQPSDNMRMILNYSLAVPYSFECGVSVSVDELHSLPAGGMFASNDTIYKVRLIPLDDD